MKKESYTRYELSDDEAGFPAKLIRNALERLLSYGIALDKGGVESRFATDGAKSIINVYRSQRFGKPTKGIKLQVAAAPGNEHFQLELFKQRMALMQTQKEI